MTLRGFLSIFVFALFWSAAALAGNTDPDPGGHPGSSGGHFADGQGTWAPHPGWGGSGSMQHFNPSYWQGGHWWHGPYAGRLGWWWIVGPDWYWYPAASYPYPYPDPFTPAYMARGFWYWCDAYQQYYPYVGACPSGWRAMPPQ